MPPVGVVALVGFYLIAAIVALLPFIIGAIAQGNDDGFFPDDSPLFLLMNNIGLIVLIPVSLLVVRLVHRERPGFLSSVTGRLRWRLLVPFTLIALGAQFISYLLVALIPALGGLESVAEESPTPPEPATIAAFLIVILLTTPLQAAAEEYAFRGYLSQAVGFYTRSWLIPAVITGLLFAAAHGSQDLAAFTDRFAFGFVASYVTWRSGGLEAAIADHAVNNVVILGIGSFFGNPLPDTNIQTTLPWPLVGVDVLGMVIFALAVTWYCRRRDLQRRSTVLMAELPPAPPASPGPGGPPDAPDQPTPPAPPPVPLPA
jgi:membrane protease YdiL (CAAX protease family)